jgi:hypothetical protein
LPGWNGLAYFVFVLDPFFVSECEIDAEFTDFNYKPAPDGQFTIKLANPEQVSQIENCTEH